MLPEYLYRYEDVVYGIADEDAYHSVLDVRIVKRKYKVINETDCGYWIHRYGSGRMFKDKKWVSKVSKKRFAHTSKIDAFNSFVARKHRQIQILTHQLDRAKTALVKSASMITKVETDNEEEEERTVILSN